MTQHQGSTSAVEVELRLYVSGQTPRSLGAVRNLRRLCDDHLAGRHRIEVIDLLSDPAAAHRDDILAVPALVRVSPPPVRRVIGDLSDTVKVLSILGVEDVGLTVRRRAEDSRLRRRLDELEAELRAIKVGEVDTLVASDAAGEHMYARLGSAEPYRVIVEKMGEGAATLSDDGVVLFANRSLGTLLGVPSDALVGQDLTPHVTPECRPAVDSLLEGAVGETRKEQLLLVGPDGEVPVIVTVTALSLDDAVVRCVVVTDLTEQVERHRAEQAVEAREREALHQVAREVNDTIVQGLVAAEVALDLDQVPRARGIIASTSGRAREWIGVLAGDVLNAGMGVRAAPLDPGGGR